MSQEQTGFILTRNWRDTDRGVELELWLSTPEGPRCLQIPGQQGVFFLPCEDLPRMRELLAGHFNYRVQELDLMDFELRPVAGVYFSSQRQLRQARDQLREAGMDPLEADINPVERYLMELQ